MPFDLSDPSDLAIFVALVGLSGTVVGALIGLLATSIATRRQIDRQERATRREAYANHLGSVMAMERFHTATGFLHEQHTQVFRQVTEYRAERLSAEDNDTKNEIAKVIKRLDRDLDRLSEEIRIHESKFDEVHIQLLASAHRLKIAGHPDVHDAAMEIYRWLSFMAELQSDGAPQGVMDRFNEALQIFSLTARADTLAPGKPSPRKGRRDAQRRLKVLKQNEPNRPT